MEKLARSYFERLDTLDRQYLVNASSAIAAMSTTTPAAAVTSNTTGVVRRSASSSRTSSPLRHQRTSSSRPQVLISALRTTQNESSIGSVKLMAHPKTLFVKTGKITSVTMFSILFLSIIGARGPPSGVKVVPPFPHHRLQQRRRWLSPLPRRQRLSKQRTSSRLRFSAQMVSEITN